MRGDVALELVHDRLKSLPSVCSRGLDLDNGNEVILRVPDVEVLLSGDARHSALDHDTLVKCDIVAIMRSTGLEHMSDGPLQKRPLV